MDMIKLNNAMLIGGSIGLAAFVLWWMAKGTEGATKALVGGSADLAGGILSGTVKGVGEGVFGIPDTDPAQCAAARAAGSTMQASKYCSASDFLSYLWKGK